MSVLYIMSQWTPNSSDRESRLSSMIQGTNLSAHDKQAWTDQAKKAFIDLISAPTLGLSEPALPFIQCVD